MKSSQKTLMVGMLIILALFGGALIYWGVRARMIENRLEALLPPTLRQLRPTRRADPVTFGY